MKDPRIVEKMLKTKERIQIIALGINLLGISLLGIGLAYLWFGWNLPVVVVLLTVLGNNILVGRALLKLNDKVTEMIKEME